MTIDFNETECAAMEAFAHCDAAEGKRLQDEFLMNLRASIKRGELYCCCPADCNLRVNCVEMSALTTVNMVTDEQLREQLKLLLKSRGLLQC